MKNIKYQIFLFTIIVSAFLIYACNKSPDVAIKNPSGASQFGPGGSCYENSQPAGCTPITQTFAIANVSGYPGCIFNVKVKYCYQNIGGIISIVTSDYQLMNHTCTSYVDSLSYYLNTLGEADEDAFISRFDNLMYAKIENHFFGLYGGVNAVCDPNDPSKNVFTVSFFRQSCNSICYVYISPEDKDPRGGDSGRDLDPVNSFIKSPCTSQGCCKRDVTMCYNPNTNTIVKNVIVTPYSLTTPNPIETCASGVVQVQPLPSYVTLVKCSPCSYKCEDNPSN